MFTLRLSHDWASQVRSLRDALTDDTNLIREDNGFYRICRDGPGRAELLLQPGCAPERGIVLELRTRDLYVERIGGERIATYAQTLNMLRPQAASLDAAVLDLRHEHGTRRFELQSLLVLAVAESLRNDHTATTIEQLIRGGTTRILGVGRHLPVDALLREAHAWGQASEAIVRALSPVARDIVLRPREALTPLQRRYSERVDLAAIEPALREEARRLKVIKRPG